MEPRQTAILLLMVLGAGSVIAQPPDLGPFVEPVDEALGQTVPPALDTAYTVLGQNLTREDVRMFLDLNITRADAGILGLLVGSGSFRIDANIDVRVEMRVISSERIKNLVIGSDPYNISAENASFLAEVFLPAEVFRLTLSAEALAQFQAEQGAMLGEFIEEAVPELEVREIQVTWENTFLTDALTDLSLTEPPIIAEVSAKVRFLTVESARSLLESYLGKDEAPEDPRAAAVQAIKKENADPLRTRDFFAAAAYTQMLNLSLQPGWSLDVTLRVPRGFSFEYFNDAVDVSHDRRTASFRIDGDEGDPLDAVVVASLTQRRAVAVALFVAMWTVIAVLGAPVRGLYAKRRVPRLLAPKEREPDYASKAGEPPSTEGTRNGE